MLKQICDAEELRKAFIVANLFDRIQNIQGELQKQLDGVMLPVCSYTLRDGVSQADSDAIAAIFAQQVARDWRTVLSTEAQRTVDIDTAIKTDNVIQQIKQMNNAEYDAWWAANVTTAAQAIGVLKRVVRVLCRRVL